MTQYQLTEEIYKMFLETYFHPDKMEVLEKQYGKHKVDSATHEVLRQCGAHNNYKDLPEYTLWSIRRVLAIYLNS